MRRRKNINNKKNIAKPIVTLFLNKGSKSSGILVEYIAKYIDYINQKIHINIIYLNKKTTMQAKKLGVRNTPTLCSNGRLYANVESILKELLPTTREKPHKPAENLDVDSWFRKVIEEGDEPGIQDDFNSNLFQKMHEFQQKRPEMKGVKNRLKGGRKIKPKRIQNRTYSSDADGEALFIQDSGCNMADKIPGLHDNIDAELMMNEYYMNVLIDEGRLPSTTKRR